MVGTSTSEISEALNRQVNSVSVTFQSCPARNPDRSCFQGLCTSNMYDSESDKHEKDFCIMGWLKLTVQLGSSCRHPLALLREMLALSDAGTTCTLMFLLRGHSGTTRMHIKVIITRAWLFLSCFFFLSFFFLSPSEISQSDSLERIEANAFENLPNLSEM